MAVVTLIVRPHCVDVVWSPDEDLVDDLANLI